MSAFEKRSLGICLLLLAATLFFFLFRPKAEVERPDRVARIENPAPAASDRVKAARPVKGKSNGVAETTKPDSPSPLAANRDEKNDRLCDGKVLNKESQPIAGATVFLLLIKEDSEWREFLPPHGHNGSAVDFLRKISLDRRTTAGDGRFQFLLPTADDRSTFAVVAAGPGGTISDKEDCHHGDGMEHTLIIPEEKHAILGTVRDESGLPITGATVRIFCEEYFPDCAEIADARLWFPSGFCGTEIRCDDGGRYRIDWSENWVSNISFIEAVADGYASVRKVILGRDSNETSPQRIDFVMERGGNVNGKVTDEGGNSLRATVSADIGGSNRHVANCREDGTYRLEGVPETTVELVVECKGYYMETRIIDIASSNTVNFILRQMPKVTFSGRVIDRESGEPIEGAWISANGSSQRATANDGTFLFTCPVNGDEIDLGASYDNYIRLDKAIALNGRSEVAEIIFDLEKKTTIVVKTVEAETGSGIDAEVMATGQRKKKYQPSQKWRSMEPPTTYVAEFEIPPGEYLIRAEAKGYAPAERRITVAKGQEEEVLLKLQRNGEAIVPPSNPQLNLNVPITSPEGSVELSGEITVNGLPFTGTVSFSQVPLFSLFTLGPNGDDGLPTEGGKYRLLLSPGPYECILYKTKRMVARFRFEVPEGVARATKDFRLVGYRLAGAVTDATTETPLPLTTVTLVPLLEEPSFELTRLTDTQGRFAIEGIPPGAYRLFFSGKEHSSIREVRMEGDIPDSRFKIERGGDFEFSITDHDGNLLSSQYDSDDPQTSLVMERFHFFWPPGHYSVKVDANGFRSKSLSFAIEEGKTTVIKAVLDPE